MSERVDRVKVSPETVTVLGTRPKGKDDPLWAGLDLDRAEPHTQSTLMLFICGSEAPEDIHLSVPWCHPEDQAQGLDDDGVRYRVRPRMEPGRRWKNRIVKSALFERWDGEWMIAIRTTPRTRNKNGTKAESVTRRVGSATAKPSRD